MVALVVAVVEAEDMDNFRNAVVVLGGFLVMNYD